MKGRVCNIIDKSYSNGNQFSIQSQILGKK